MKVEIERKDLRRLNSILSMSENLQYAYDGLSDSTKDYLREEFEGETELHLINFERNICDVIDLIKSGDVK